MGVTFLQEGATAFVFECAEPGIDMTHASSSVCLNTQNCHRQGLEVIGLGATVVDKM
jgi:hypothetical protein